MSPVHLFRQRGSAGADHVSFIELFFDLVFVFTIIQLSHTLAHHYTPRGFIEGIMLVLAIWWVWVYTTWVANWINPEHWISRCLFLGLMLVGLLLSTSIPEAFGERGLIFGIAFAVMQVGRSAVVMCLLRGVDERNYRNFIRITSWLALAGVFWVAGALDEGDRRMLLWGIALGIEYLSAAVGFWLPVLGCSTGRDWEISGAHMAERCALFIIICLGETILVMGNTLTRLELSPTLFLAFVTAFVTTILLWWIYFRFGHQRAAELIKTSDNPGALGRLAYTYAHIPLVAGIILTAVGAEFLLAHPQDVAGWKWGSALIGGPAVYLIGNLLFKTIAWGRVPLSHCVGLALLAVLALTATGLTVLTLAILVVGTLAVVAFWELRALDHPL
ncbi:low temperature requirement protein A [Billgrantia sp. Q4P2]|uniref:low temperature requirement protein A n=1 Tax=Billgrantia sp. Q4P2 TaxID=3463857 RepID=UPI0040562A62